MKMVPHWEGLSPRRVRLFAALSIALLAAVSNVLIGNSAAKAADECTNVPTSLNAPVYPSTGVILCSSEGINGAFNHAYSFQFQGDCNLVLLTGRWQPLWSSNTGGRSCTSTNSCLALQGDGNLVLYWPNGCGNQPTLWDSGTGNNPSNNYCLTMQSDGNLVIYVPSPGNPCGYGGNYLNGPRLPTWTQSSHTKPQQGADSWRTHPVDNGRTNCPYVCKSTAVNYRAIDIFSARQPSWSGPVQNALTAWNQGPISYSFNVQPNDNENWIYASYPGDPLYTQCGGFLSGALGVTIYYDSAGNVIGGPGIAVMALRTRICLDQNQHQPIGSYPIGPTIAHELGHTLRLAHNYRDNTSAMWPVLSTGGSSTPNSNDIGSPSPGCPPRGSYGGLGGGVMCIYGWGD